MYDDTQLVVGEHSATSIASINLNWRFEARMSEPQDCVDTTMPPSSNWGHQWNEHDSSQSPIELTPPSASSVGELTPASDADVLSDPIGRHGGVDDSSSVYVEDDPTVKLATAIEGVVSSLVKTANPLTRQQAWESVQTIAEGNIARIAGRELSWSSASELTRNNIEECPKQGTTCPASQDTRLQSYREPTAFGREASLDLIQQDEDSRTRQSLKGKSLDISLRVLVGDSPQIPLSRTNSRVNKKRSQPTRRRLPSGDGSSNTQAPRRGRPSERGFSCSRCAIAKKKCIGNDNCCDNCSKSTIYRQLCIKADFKESRLLLHDLYKTRIRTLLNNVVETNWQDPSWRPVEITISNGFDSRLEIEVQKYVALDENALTHRIFRGLEPGTTYPTARSTPFSLRDGTLTAQKIDRYCEKLACDMILRESLGLTHNSLLNHIILFAVAQINAEDMKARIEGLDMVRLALRFWAIQAIFFTYPWRVERGGHLIGMFPLQLRGYWNGITLLPRLVNQELDKAFETRMDEIEKEILEKLQAAIFKRHRDSWCSIFLTSFILLHSLERDTWNMSAWQYETSNQGPAAWPLRKSPSEYCHQNKHIADIVATHFKIVNQGSSPLKINWNNRLNQQLLNNSIPARNFIKSIQSDFDSPTSRYKPELFQSRQFARGDPQSLNHLYTRMLFGE
ncbi:hypothetical protein F4859DRAFT_476062 [Xylaria cf. heliscus]|nr:hypothetical protein F4859DRAFT_476062 [Xylaria cf. heliscus]